MSELKKSLGLIDGISLLIGITIGSAIFATPQIIASYSVSFFSIILLWIVVTCFVFIGSLIYAELGSRFPNTGGEYIYINKAFGPFWGFIFGWSQLLIIRTSPAAGISLITANYIGYFIEMNQFQKNIVAIAIIIIFGIINFMGVERASAYNKFSSLVKTIGIVVFTFAGLMIFGGDFSNLPESINSTQNLGPIGNAVAAIILVLFSYLGWDRVGYVAGEMKNPKDIIPRTMFYGIGTIAIIYLSANLLYHTVMGLEGVRNSNIVASDTASILFGNIGASIVSMIVIISATGSINGTMMSASRLYYAMAKDGLLFSWFNHIHPSFKTPTHSIIAHCIWGITLLVVRQNFETIVSGMVFTILIFYIVTTLALFRFRKLNIGQEGYRIPFYPLLPLIYLIGLIVLVSLRLFYQFNLSIQDLSFVLTGVPIYFLFFKQKVNR
ncbi:MAG: amino acid permease [Candidatus Neomarinimicrobiota bacterium]|mgnify:FL=1|nr:amino acid permease [Candidatus Neomarinimicrobiota bacterium]MEC9474519.1 amino acid permease [Candidatus Neomarinimicrobiota bacterium]MED5433808.1 amino acid permease [Candidatus Neomarinimicrobiota bacterium]